MADLFLKFVDQNADALDPALRAYGQGADRVTSVKDFVDQVLAKLGPNDCIRKLQLIGHGSPGNIGVGSGKRAARGGNDSLDLNNVARWEPQLRRLRCRFCKPDGEFELIGCNTGAGLKGARLLRLIVNFIRCCRARAPVDPVSPLKKSEVDQIVEAIGEGVDEKAKLPEPIEPTKLKTVAFVPAVGPNTLIAGEAVASAAFYAPGAIVGARLIGVKGAAIRKRDAGKALMSEIVRSLAAAEVALAPLGLYAVEGFVQLQVRISEKRTKWLPPGALVGGYAWYSPFGADTTFLYELSPAIRERLASTFEKEPSARSRKE